MEVENNFSRKKWISYWPMAIGPLAMAVAYVLYTIEPNWVLSKHALERLHILLIGIAFVVFLSNAVRNREFFHYIMSGLSFAFLCRELHFKGTSLGVYIAVALLAVWAISNWQQIEAIMEQGQIKPWLYATGATYVLSQLIARRVFKHIHLPNEQCIHVMLEEVVETIAHCMIIVTATISYKAKSASEQGNENDREASFTETSHFDNFDLDTH